MMDEPFGALDAMTRQGLQDEMLEIAREHGRDDLLRHPRSRGGDLSRRPRDRPAAASRPRRHRTRDRPAAPARSGRDPREPGVPALRRELYDFIHAAEAGGARMKAAEALVLPGRSADPARRDRRARRRRRATRRAARPRSSPPWSGALGDGSLLLATRDTLISAFGGLAIGAGARPRARHSARLAAPRWTGCSSSTIELLRPIPSVAVIPIALVALGFGYSLEIAIVSFACFWPLLILSRAAVRGVEPRLIEVARALRLSRPAGNDQDRRAGRPAPHLRRLPARRRHFAGRRRDGRDRGQSAGSRLRGDDREPGAAPGAHARLYRLDRLRRLRAQRLAGARPGAPVRPAGRVGGAR